MARKRDKSKQKNAKKYEDSDESDTTVNYETASVMSNQSVETNDPSERKSKRQQQAEAEADANEVEEVDQFETKLDTVLDFILNTKCAKMRLKHWTSLKQALVTRFCFELLEERKASMNEIFERGMRGSDEEIEATATVMALTFITFGTSDDFGEEILAKHYVLLDRTLMNPVGKPNARAKCALALSLGCFITELGMEKSQDLQSHLLSIAFGPVNTKQLDGAQLADYHNLQATCLDMFAFLASIESDEYLESMLKSNIDKFTRCLMSSSLSVRIAAGECAAMLMENSDYSSLSSSHGMDQLCDHLEQLSTDSQKSRSKKELRTQRTNFRLIMQTVQGESITPEEIRFGPEKLTIDTWKLKRYYDSLCALIGNGINVHLCQNGLLRDIFSLGAPNSIDETIGIKVPKHEKQFIHNLNRKNRDMTRNKMRDRRQRMLDV